MPLIHPRRARAAVLALAAALALACSSTGNFDVTPQNAAEQIALAEEDLSQERAGLAFARLQEVWEIPSLTPAERQRVEELIRQAVPRIGGIELDGDELIDMAELELPRNLRVELALRGARRLLDEGERMKSYREVRKIEKEFPAHVLRTEAADIVAGAGFSLADDDGHYLLFFPYRGKAPEVLEFLVLTYPASIHCARAYDTLARLYEEDGEWTTAMERHQDLLRYHVDSPYASYSEARIPYLRMVRVQGVEYDRQEIERARAELEGWLERHSDHEIEIDVQELLAECRRMLIDNDLVIARFYQKVESYFGARYHAERALEEAALLADAGRTQECEDLLAVLVEAGSEFDPTRVLSPTYNEPTDTGFGMTIDQDTGAGVGP